jgi:hypothetical protein
MALASTTSFCTRNAAIVRKFECEERRKGEPREQNKGIAREREKQGEAAVYGGVIRRTGTGEMPPPEIEADGFESLQPTTLTM